MTANVLRRQRDKLSTHSRRASAGLTLVELLVTLALAAVVMAGLSGVIGTGLQVQAHTQLRNDLTQQASFALQRMASSVRNSRRLLLPLNDNPATNWREHVRQQSVPAATPEGDSTLATAVLAVTLNPTLDLDGDGWSDANNDKDYLDLNNNGSRDSNESERIDEDPWGDNSNDGAPGIIGIDDNGDGGVDDSSATFDFPDDDEDDSYDEEARGQGDDDGDGSVDEDMDRDENGDGAPGIAGVDDDYDGIIDEGDRYDDDEDGQEHEDSYEPVVYYLSGSQLYERLPSLNDVNGDATVDGKDFTESVVAEQVSYFGVERLAGTGAKTVLVELTLELSGAEGQKVRLNTRVRLESGL